MKLSPSPADAAGVHLSLPTLLCVPGSPPAQYVTLPLPLVAPRRVDAPDLPQLREILSPLARHLSRPAARVSGARLRPPTRQCVPQSPLQIVPRTFLLGPLGVAGWRVVPPHHLPSPQ